MSMNIKSAEVERLVSEITAVTGETKTEAIRKSLEERRAQVKFDEYGSSRAARTLRFLEDEAWPALPKSRLGKRLTRAQEDEILGYGKHGV